MKTQWAVSDISNPIKLNRRGGMDAIGISPVKCYVVTFFGQDGSNCDDEPVVFYAVDDETAKEYADAKWTGPYQITERITTWRVVS